MNTFLFLHLILLGLWGGCVAVEMVLEFSTGNDIKKKHHTAQLHYLIDIYVELPILIMVLLSGLFLLSISRLTDPLYAAKVVAGLFPVVINFLCIIPVVKRKRASDKNDEPQMDRNTKLIYLAFFTGLAGAMISLGLGMYFLGII